MLAADQLPPRPDRCSRYSATTTVTVNQSGGVGARQSSAPPRCAHGAFARSQKSRRRTRGPVGTRSRTSTALVARSAIRRGLSGSARRVATTSRPSAAEPSSRVAPFDGPEVDAALRAALDDRDWQVRQAAEDLLEEQ